MFRKSVQDKDGAPLNGCTLTQDSLWPSKNAKLSEATLRTGTMLKRADNVDEGDGSKDIDYIRVL